MDQWTLVLEAQSVPILTPVALPALQVPLARTSEERSVALLEVLAMRLETRAAQSAVRSVFADRQRHF